MNLMLAACRARDVTHIRNAAREPEVVDLCHCLARVGSHPRGGDRPSRNSWMMERISRSVRTTTELWMTASKAGHFLSLEPWLATLRIHGCREEHQAVLIEKLRTIGAHITIETPSIIMITKVVNPKAIDITTGPYPALSTDLQPQLTTLLCISQGVSQIHETVFERRFNHAADLLAMGAKIQVVGQTAIIHGVQRLVASTVNRPPGRSLSGDCCNICAGCHDHSRTGAYRSGV